MNDVPALRDFVAALARRAGSDALAARRRLGSRVAYDTKSSPTDPVTVVDRSTERLVVDAIRSAHPDDSIVGEEGAAHEGTSALAWHIDPIDGTANFVYGLPGWCTSIAVVDEVGPLAGAVHVPVGDELFSAARGAGATLTTGFGTEQIRCSDADDLARALVATGFSYDRERRTAQATRIARLIGDIRDIRRTGSAAADLCAVACGRVDAYFEEHLNSWDLAAGVLIAAEAGAVTSNFAAGPAGTDATVAAAPGIHQALLAAIAAADA